MIYTDAEEFERDCDRYAESQARNAERATRQDLERAADDAWVRDKVVNPNDIEDEVSDAGTVAYRHAEASFRARHRLVQVPTWFWNLFFPAGIDPSLGMASNDKVDRDATAEWLACKERGVLAWLHIPRPNLCHLSELWTSRSMVRGDEHVGDDTEYLGQLRLVPLADLASLAETDEVMLNGVTLTPEQLAELVRRGSA
jgi:hypothetical protein